ncbi:putative diphthamide synthesis protein-domain-containing protein [Microdochium trichocladiopsis]|uniref:2-(3-amino-3-carboxypropyl)histidine synthase subunit 2 n=1 Tax=Microdochium trichocladiopsis TaxID=1682393 RepID=A0A9P8XXT4_9PEZI|nr:putative diphthamide synthesis protein-domain-containing protein [Microdochium trichocladiopsis]KAH7018462.1 putative diphthamide synthesis protein-domain-containing protein [Microdochium trichocladiopsis]
MAELTSAPVLSTPAEHTFVEDPTPTSIIEAAQNRAATSDEEKLHVYEIARTARHIRQQRWRRIALQFPDAMLPDGPWVAAAAADTYKDGEQRLYILADTSYSACCVDEIAAEHADADAVVHYGRACLSPTSRIPVLHVFTRQALDYEDVVLAFESEFKDKEASKIVVMADVMFQEHVLPVCERLRERGYKHISATEIVHDPAATVPNRRILDSAPADASEDKSAAPESTTATTQDELRDHHLFHISAPPTALLMTLSSRLSSLRIYPTPSSPYSPINSDIPDPSMTPRLLQRRYALVIRLATASVIGILVNTLSVKNYMDTISRLKAQIAAAGKKSYTIVVGKLNPAKLANFAEIDGWVVVGCWESGLVEQDGMWKPIITPFEMGLALQGDDKRVWTGEWWAGIEERQDDEQGRDDLDPGDISDEESAPPEFDLRTGKLISNSRPMRGLAIRSSASKSTTAPADADANLATSSSALAKRATGEIASINGIASPGAEYLRTQRTWQGLGTDFDGGEDGVVEESTVVEEGRSGIARGYTVGEDHSRT